MIQIHNERFRDYFEEAQGEEPGEGFESRQFRRFPPSWIDTSPYRIRQRIKFLGPYEVEGVAHGDIGLISQVKPGFSNWPDMEWNDHLVAYASEMVGSFQVTFPGDHVHQFFLPDADIWWERATECLPLQTMWMAFIREMRRADTLETAALKIKNGPPVPLLFSSRTARDQCLIAQKTLNLTEAEKKLAQAAFVRAKAHKTWATSIMQRLGDVSIEWTVDGCVLDGHVPFVGRKP